LLGGGKKYTFNIGGAGCAKQITRAPTHINRDPIQIYGFGQDSIAIFKTQTQLLLSLADGHGSKKEGQDISYKIHEYILTYIAESQAFILNKLREHDNDSVISKINELFALVNDIILNKDEITSKYNMGGTTLTILHKIIDPIDGTLYSLSYNIGDSPYFKINSNTSLDELSLEELSENQNCDNIKCVESYYNHCLTKGVTPSPIILGRFNKPNYYKTPWMGDEPIEPYKSEIIDGKYKITQNTDVMKKFYEGAPASLKQNTLYSGGSQSIRDKLENISGLAYGLFPMENFGSTINGDLQNIYSFGDKKSYINHHITCIPHVSINQINSSHYDFVGSDGPIDCLTNADILDMFKEKPNMTMSEFITFVNITIDTKASEGGFRFSIFGNVPLWDDNSYWVVDTIVEDDLESKIRELEIEHSKLIEIAIKIKLEIDKINEVIKLI
jgi:serine/threonine protein phosphatase PrpC